MNAQARSEKVEQILEALREGLPEYQAAKNAGITWATFWNWKEADPGLYARVEDAKRARVGLLEDALYKAAMKGSVTACLTLLRKESKQWREMLDGQIVPSNDPGTQRAAIAGAAAAGVATVLAMLAPEKRERLRVLMRQQGMIVLPPPSTNGHHHNGNGTNGNGAGPH